MIKIIFLSIISFLTCASCSSDKKNAGISIKNPSDFDRLTELVEIPLSELKEKIISQEVSGYVVKTSDGKLIPSQITYDEKLIFRPELKAGEEKSFIIATGEPHEFDSQTYGRFITERKDDFAWENDRVAFRVYGPALVEIDGPSNGLDIWYKRTSDLIIDKWYKNDLAGIASYHKDNGEGLDDYKVGRTLGAGAMAPYVNGKLLLNENFKNQEILDNGPLRTTFALIYSDMDIDSVKVTEKRIISLDAGSQLTKIVQTYSFPELRAAAGIVKRGDGDTVIFANNYVIYGEPASKSVDKVYVAVVMKDGINETKVDTYEITHPKSGKLESHSHILAITSVLKDKPAIYYTGYGWSKFGFPSIDSFKEYIEKFAESLKNPLEIIYQKK
ncbi:MAG: DUF4861 domain-containing protein [Prevotellaceae bacterium]|jgi:hypothetical protein|nr:DUF4861 domain-containing protein [Prevotellaceae bacterium]